MPLIKADHPVAQRVATFSMNDIEIHACAIVAKARQQADQLLADARQQVETARQEALARGLAEGRRQGIARGHEEGLQAGQQQAVEEHRAKLGELAKTLGAAASELNASREKLQLQALDEVVELALAIARRVTKRQAQVDPQVLAANVAEALKLAVAATDVRIAINPAQRELLDQMLPTLKLQWPRLQHVQLVEDASVALGGCRVYSRDGQIDADVDTQLDRIIAELLPEPSASL